MIIGVMSDTHGNRKLMHRVAAQMAASHRAALIFHLGDDYGDGEELDRTGLETCIIPGLWCSEYGQLSVPNKRIETFDGVSFACAHADKDLAAREFAADVIMTGHTHVAQIEKRGGSIYLNPGHLKSDFDRGQHPSYAIVQIRPEILDVAIHEIGGAVRASESFFR